MPETWPTPFHYHAELSVIENEATARLASLLASTQSRLPEDA